MVKIGVDVMSGDRPPSMLIAGCVRAAQTLDTVVVIVGEEQLVQKELKKYDYPSNKIMILPSTEVITMHDNPAKAFRQKENSSLMVGCNALVQDAIDAFCTVGNIKHALRKMKTMMCV